MTVEGSASSRRISGAMNGKVKILKLNVKNGSHVESGDALVHRDGLGRSSSGCRQRERPDEAVRVEDTLALRERLDARAKRALVEVVAGLLPLREIHTEAQAVFLDAEISRRRLAPELLIGSLGQQLKGEVKIAYDATGFVYVLNVPMASLVART